MLTNKMTPAKKMTTARAGLVLDEAFFGSLCMNLKIKEDPSCPTLYVDGINIGYNPDFIGKFERHEISKIKGMLAKSVMHLILGHHVRRGDRDQGTWQRACNMIVNALIKKAKFELPDESSIDLDNAKRQAEILYNEIWVEKPKTDSGQQPNQNDQGGNQGQQPSGNQSGNQPGPNQSGQGGQPDPNGVVQDLPPRSPKDGQQSSPADKAQSEQKWKVNAKQAMQFSKGMGSTSGDMERIVDERNQSKQDWRDVLREFIEKTALNDFSWSRPNRRYIQFGIYLPSLQPNEELVTAMCYVDASGSITDEELAQFGGELTKILEDFPHIQRMIVNYFDTNIKTADKQEFTQEDLPLQLKTRAGGGTDFMPVFEDIAKFEEKEGAPPKFVIIFTDLECNRFPSEEPGYPVIWGKINDSRYARTPPFGETIDVELDQAA